MDTSKALAILEDCCADRGIGMLELLQYMGECDLDEFSSEEIRAYRVAMVGFRQLFAPVEAA